MRMLTDAAVGGGGGGPTVIHLSEEEQAAVKRLTDLGFDRQAAAQAYLACDKNEEMAANFLFDSGGMIDDDMDGGDGDGGADAFPMMGGGGGDGGDGATLAEL